MVDRWPLTGRGEELRVIGDVLNGSERRGVVVAGQAGVGKTRLARAAAERAARSGWTVHHVAGTATGRQVTLGAFARWADPTDTSPLSLARKLFGKLTAANSGAPLLIMVDDAHLLDDLSALVVHQLVLQDIARVIATIRAGETAPDAVTALWKDGQLRRLELQPLSRSESDLLLQAVLDGVVSAEAAARMWTLSRGNVLFLHHLVEHERDSGRLDIIDDEWRLTATPSASPSLVELVEMQVGAVPEDVGEVVDLVAIAEPLDRGVLAALTSPQSIDSAEQQGLISADGDAVYVGHPLYGEIRIGKCGPLRLARLRGRIATAMKADDSIDPLRLGLLCLESDLPPDAEILSRAANIAALRVDLGVAERLARAAVDADPSPTIKLALAHILFLQEQGQAAEEILDSLSSTELVAPGFVDGVILRAANLLGPLRNPEQSRAVIEDALGLGDGERMPSLLTYHGVQLAMSARPADTIATMKQVEYARLDTHGRLLGYSAETIAFGDMGLAKEASEKAAGGYRMLDESPLDAFHGTGLSEFHAYALLAAGFVAEAVAVAEHQHEQYANLPGQTRTMAIAAVGMTELARGDLQAAARCFSSASEGFGGYGEVSGLSYRFRILHTAVLARSGAVEAAAASLDWTRSSRHPAYEYVESDYLLASAWVAAVQGRVDEACELALRAADFARDHGQYARELMCLQTAVQLGDASRAPRLAELATRLQGPRAPLTARYADALANDDATVLDAVSLEFEAMGDALAAADAAAQAAESFQRAEQRGSALTAGARAHRIAKDCGGAVSPALASARVPLPFTRREHEIATLLSQGLTNRDIADAMSLSIRTVEGHIYQASIKAGVTSRAELSDLVEQFNTLQTG